MRFGNTSLFFDESCEMSDRLSKILEGDDEDRLEYRKSLNSCMDKLGGPNSKLALEIDENVTGLITEYAGIFFTAGYIIGQAFDITDPEALKEIEFLRKKLKGIIPIWGKEKAPETLPGTPGASSEQ